MELAFIFHLRPIKSHLSKTICQINNAGAALKHSKPRFAISNRAGPGFPFAIGGELRAILVWRRFVNASRKLCCTPIMKGQTSKNWRAMLVSVLWTRLTLENWRAKLISLVLATTVWYLIKKSITTTESPSERPSPTPVTETR